MFESPINAMHDHLGIGVDNAETTLWRDRWSSSTLLYCEHPLPCRLNS